MFCKHVQESLFTIVTGKYFNHKYLYKNIFYQKQFQLKTFHSLKQPHIEYKSSYRVSKGGGSVLCASWPRLAVRGPSPQLCSNGLA